MPGEGDSRSLSRARDLGGMKWVRRASLIMTRESASSREEKPGVLVGVTNFLVVQIFWGVVIVRKPALLLFFAFFIALK